MSHLASGRPPDGPAETGGRLFSGMYNIRAGCELYMKDLLQRLEKLLTDVEDCALISKPATDRAKRETFAKIADQLRDMATELETVIAAKIGGDRALLEAVLDDLQAIPSWWRSRNPQTDRQASSSMHPKRDERSRRPEHGGAPRVHQNRQDQVLIKAVRASSNRQTSCRLALRHPGDCA